ncbi:hypothetical protein AG4045_000787 [Apium graveolens]|uniref:Calmodulin-binding domain-containing protein n=1 Tax=Apium graveolens TaxID=4045 RepID=A0A6L5B6U3_APIGR|nr:hypothetical protein AG4045_000787 [Apium graveolens]
MVIVHLPLHYPSRKLTLNENQTKNLHEGDVATANEVLDTMQTNGHTQISQSTTSLFQSHASSEAQAELFPSHANESVELVCTDSEISEFYEDIDVEALQDIEYIIDIYDSEDSEYVEERDEINIENDDVINISKVDASISLHHTKKDEQYTLEDKEIPVSKSMFQRGRLVDLESENDIPRKLKFRRDRVMKNENGTKTYVGMRRLSVDNTNPTSANAQYADSYDLEDFDYSDGETDGSKAENSDAVSISRVDTLKGKQYQRNDKLFSSRDDHLALKGKFSRVKIMDVQSENDVAKRLKFRRRRVVEDLDDAKPYVERIKLKKRETDGNTNTTSPGSDYSDSCYYEDSKEFNSGNDVVDISEADILEGKHHKNSRKGRQFTSEEYNPAYKCKFRRGRILDLQCEDDTPSKLKFRRGKVIENEDGTKTYVERIRFKRRDTDDNTNATSPDCEYIDSYYSEDPESETIEFNSENGDVASINNNVDILQGKNLRHPRKYKHFASEEDSPAYKCNFRRGRTMDLQNDDNVPKRLKFKRGRVIEKDDGTKIYIRRRRFKKKEIVNNVDTSSPDSHTVALRHQEMQDKKDELLLLNDVIEETITKLARSKKSKVKALVGAFETVISLQDDKTSPG